MKHWKLISSSIFVLALGLVLLTTIGFRPKVKSGYVEVGKLYQEFTLSKELDAKFSELQLIKKQILDSLILEIQILENKPLRSELEKNKLTDIQREYIIKEQRFMEDNQELNSQFTDQINEQISIYLNDFQKKYGYDFIFGAHGSGNLLAANKELDITDQIILFVNNKYAGK